MGPHLRSFEWGRPHLGFTFVLNGATPLLFVARGLELNGATLRYWGHTFDP